MTSFDINMDSASPSPFARLDETLLTPETALEQCRQYGFLWVRLDDVTPAGSQNTANVLRQEFAESSQAYKRNWSVENLGDCATESELSADAVLGSLDGNGPNRHGRFYVSTIVHRNEADVIKRLLKKTLPFQSQPPLLGDSRHDGGVWLFLGRNNGQINQTKARKRKRRDEKEEESTVLAGRAEHVDEVSHSGTWHVQLSGTKTWLIRPNSKSPNWEKTTGGPPDLSTYSEAEQSATGGRAWRLRIVVKEGDLFVLNTRAWYHQTILTSSPHWSISLARDFYLPAATLLCPRDAKAGEILFDEDDIPNELPSTAEDGNCALAEIEHDNHEDSSDAEERIAIVAIKDVKEGEPLVLCADVGAQSDEDSVQTEEEGEYNASERIDPRAIAGGDCQKNDCILSGDDIPQDLPRSLEPNCELVESNGEVSLIAIRAIAQGEVFSLSPEDGEDYEEVEVNLGTGELSREPK